ncbi:MAG: Do family serine endopeptidase, partial [Acidobacteria bacterium]|nr:Do family serine endopeptidase [Acidobacteriota bacterium]
RLEESLGSGVIVSSDGYLLTNNHVVEGASEIKVVLPDQRQLKGRVVGTDPLSDIAVVKVNANHLPPITMGDSSKVKVGDFALAFGDPFGVGETMTMGIVSATGRGGLGIEDYENFIQTDAAINPGNSGGGLVSADGELIGISTAILSGGGGNEGIGFAIPVNMARFVMDQILQHGKVIRGYLGVAVQTLGPSLAKAFNVSQAHGALVSDVEPGSPAERAGLKRGDIITALNGQQVDDARALSLDVAKTAPGTVVTLTVSQNGAKKQVPVTLGELPTKPETTAAAPPAPVTNTLQGISVQTLTPEIASDLGLPSNTAGVVITDIAPTSAAAGIGLKRGDVIMEVNQHPVRNDGEFVQQMRQADTKPALLLINRKGATTYIVVQPQ